jgi:hypothetical protein
MKFSGANTQMMTTKITLNSDDQQGREAQTSTQLRTLTRPTSARRNPMTSIASLSKPRKKRKKRTKRKRKKKKKKKRKRERATKKTKRMTRRNHSSRQE